MFFHCNNGFAKATQCWMCTCIACLVLQLISEKENRFVVIADSFMTQAFSSHNIILYCISSRAPFCYWECHTRFLQCTSEIYYGLIIWRWTRVAYSEKRLGYGLDLPELKSRCMKETFSSPKCSGRLYAQRASYSIGARVAYRQRSSRCIKLNTYLHIRRLRWSSG